jgi:tetratricopeptide (TPR) repeat protein/mono/diheme cytochrome c family protein
MNRSGKLAILFLLWGGVLLLSRTEADGLAAQKHAAPAATHRTQVTYNRDVAPIIQKHCQICHRPGESGPFSLLSYEDVRSHARQIAVVTRSRFMPPWLPTRGYGEFVGERNRHLSDEELRIIQEWVAQGAVEGNPADLPPPRNWTTDWQLGKPDIVLKMSQPYFVPAQGLDVYRNFVFPVPVHQTRYIKAWEIRPGNKQVIHHCNALIDRTGLAERLDAEDPKPGFGGMEIEVASERFEPQSHLIFWKPGSVPFVEPPGMAWRVDPGTDIVLNTHMQPTGKVIPVQPEIGLYFTDQPETKFPMLIELDADRQLDIPAGAKNFLVHDDFKLPLDADALGIYPHAHYLGHDLKAYATLPDGTRKWLIWIQNWDPNWQAVFRYAKPVFLPRGTVISMRYSYDNSTRNIRNPHNPPIRIRGGNQTTDEMAHLWLQLLPRESRIGGEDARLVLQKALMEHDLQKYPGNYVANYNLAAVYQAEGNFDQAVVYYGRALEIRPKEAMAENSIGTVLQQEGRLDEAAVHYRNALRLQADYTDAHYNLGNVLMAQNDFAEAAEHFRQVLKIYPNDAKAREHLTQALSAAGGTLASEGRLDEAIGYFRQVVELEPHSADAYNNLGTALARQGNMPEAASYFEHALEIDPQHVAARRNLELARAAMARKN